MKFTVNKIFHFLLILTTLLLYPLYSIAENACDCEDPPGGRIKCEDHQVAYCRIKEGKVDGECKTPPESAKTTNELGAWVLSELLQMPIRPENVNRRSEYQKILSEGRYTNPKTGEIIRFELPRSR
jgi:hypothetical protein